MTKTYTYGAEERLTAVDGGNTASYIYDADGRRVWKTVGSFTTDCLYDLSGNVFAEFSPTCPFVCWSVATSTGITHFGQGPPRPDPPPY